MLELSEVHDYLRYRKKFPTVWCPGCGNGTVMGAVIRSIMKLGIPRDDVALVSGIGCSSRMPVYVDFNTLHTTHGRALAFATGIKLVRPDMKVVVVSGDGDSLAIGGNHFIHACRRNMGITLILINNATYGMTGGQVAPTTPIGAKAHTMPYGNIEPPFDSVELALSAGASFVARGTVHGVIQTTNYITKAIQHEGFSLVEVISQCPVLYGRLNGRPEPREMLKEQKENSIPVARARNMTAEELKGKYVTGIFRESSDRKEYTKAYADMVKHVQSVEET